MLRHLFVALFFLTASGCAGKQAPETKPPSKPAEPLPPLPEFKPAPEPDPSKGVVRPKPLTRPKVRWPDHLRHVQGVQEVRLMLTVGVDGKVSDIRVIKATHEGFAADATAMARTLTFTPGSVDGVPKVTRVPWRVVYQPH